MPIIRMPELTLASDLVAVIADRGSAFDPCAAGRRGELESEGQTFKRLQLRNRELLAHIGNGQRALAS